MKFEVLNKRGYPPERIKEKQVIILGKPRAAGEIVSFDAKQLSEQTYLLGAGWITQVVEQEKQEKPKKSKSQKE